MTDCEHDLICKSLAGGSHMGKMILRSHNLSLCKSFGGGYHMGKMILISNIMISKDRNHTGKMISIPNVMLNVHIDH